MGVLKSIAALGVGAALFYGGELYERNRHNDADFKAAYKNNAMYVVDKESRKEYSAEKLVQVYGAVRDLAAVVNDVEPRSQEGMDKSPSQAISQLERALRMR